MTGPMETRQRAAKNGNVQKGVRTGVQSDVRKSVRSNVRTDKAQRVALDFRQGQLENPVVAWPTLALFIAAWSGFLGIAYAGLFWGVSPFLVRPSS